MRRPGQVFTQTQLLEAAWDLGYEQRSNVVEVYVRYLREKIDRPFGVELDRDGARRRLPAAQGRRGVSRLPIRLRLTAAFAVAMVLVLAGAGLFVYLRLKSDLDESVTAGLDARARRAVWPRAPRRPAPPGDGEEGFAQLLQAGRRRARRRPAASAARRSAPASCGGPRPASGSSWSASVPGIEGTARVLARGPAARGRRRRPVARRTATTRSPTSSRRSRSAGRSPSSSRRCSATRSPPPALRPVEAMRRRARGGLARPAATSACRCRRPTTRSAGSARRSTRCSTACAARSSASAASWRTPATSCARRWR